MFILLVSLFSIISRQSMPHMLNVHSKSRLLLNLTPNMYPKPFCNKPDPNPTLFSSFLFAFFSSCFSYHLLFVFFLFLKVIFNTTCYNFECSTLTCLVPSCWFSQYSYSVLCHAGWSRYSWLGNASSIRKVQIECWQVIELVKRESVPVSTHNHVK